MTSHASGRPPDFIAVLKYRTTADGGRRTPAHSKYRPHVKFFFSEQMTSGEQIFLDKDIVHPGETVTAEIRILMTEYFRNTLDEGIPFEFYEGSKWIGTGRIIKLVNDELRRQ